MYKIKYTPEAKEDISDIFNYIVNILNNKTAANNLKSKLLKEEKNIQMFPYGNPEISSTGLMKYKHRRSIVNNYEIFYIIDETKKSIIITRILHHKQNIKSKLRKFLNLVK